MVKKNFQPHRLCHFQCLLTLLFSSILSTPKEVYFESKIDVFSNSSINDVMTQKVFFSLGPPIYSWDEWILGGGLSNIPDKEASTL